MRRLIVSLSFATTLLVAPAALCAPTCQDQTGGTIKCGVAGAMPVGWSPPPDVVAARDASAAADLDPNALFSLIFIVGGFFALIALMPPFDGATGADWDEQEGDKAEGRRTDRL